MELYEIIKDKLVETNVSEKVTSLVTDFLRELMFEDNEQETVESMVSNHLKDEEIELEYIETVAALIKSECLRLEETPLYKGIKSMLSEKKLIESEMTFDEKYEYLLNFPIQNKFFKDGQELEETSVHRLHDATQGVGYTLMTGSHVEEYTGETVHDKETFYLADNCDDETSKDTYEYVGKDIFEVLENIIDTEKLDLDNTQNSYYEWAIIDGRMVNHDELHRVMNHAQYIHDFHLHPVWVVQEIYEGIPEDPSIYMKKEDIYTSSEFVNHDMDRYDVYELMKEEGGYYSDGQDVEIRVYESVQSY